MVGSSSASFVRKTKRPARGGAFLDLEKKLDGGFLALAHEGSEEGPDTDHQVENRVCWVLKVCTEKHWGEEGVDSNKHTDDSEEHYDPFLYHHRSREGDNQSDNTKNGVGPVFTVIKPPSIAKDALFRRRTNDSEKTDNTDQQQNDAADSEKLLWIHADSSYELVTGEVLFHIYSTFN
jgi:hypothetical protein